MVDHMVVCYVVQEKSALPAQDWPVHGGSSTALEVPSFSSVMRQHWVCVMQICYQDNWKMFE
jgi:hypothetical protein